MRLGQLIESVRSPLRTLDVSIGRERRLLSEHDTYGLEIVST